MYICIYNPLLNNYPAEKNDIMEQKARCDNREIKMKKV